MRNGIEKALWSIAIPGFGQLLNGKYLKGVILIVLEFLINIKSNINTAIVYSFNGKTSVAVDQVNYQWLMFYPCVYLFGIWDAYRDGEKEKSDMLLYVPFAISAYIGTVGVVYSSYLKIMGILLGPIFLTLLFMIIGWGIGYFIRSLILRRISNSN